MIHPDDVKRVKAEAHICDIARAGGKRVTKKGQFHFIVCPFHADSEGDGGSCSLTPSRNIFHCFACLPAGEAVWTPKGPLPVENINPGDSVFDLTGNSTVVRATAKRLLGNSVLRIGTTVDSDGPRVTEDHIMLLIDTESSPPKIREMTAKDVRVGALLPISHIKGTRPAVSDSRAFRLGLTKTRGRILRQDRCVVDTSSSDKELLLELLEHNTDRSIGGYPVQKSNSIEFAVESIGDPNFTAPTMMSASALSAWLGGALVGMGGPQAFLPEGESLIIESADRFLIDEILMVSLLCGIPVHRHLRKHWGSLEFWSLEYLNGSHKMLLDQISSCWPSRYDPQIPFKGATPWEKIYVPGYGSMLATKVTEVAPVDYEGKYVYDLTTDSGTFCMSSVAVHNCGESGNVFKLHSQLQGYTNTNINFSRSVTEVYQASGLSFPLRHTDSKEHLDVLLKKGVQKWFEELPEEDALKLGRYEIATRLVEHPVPREFLSYFSSGREPGIPGIYPLLARYIPELGIITFSEKETESFVGVLASRGELTAFTYSYWTPRKLRGLELNGKEAPPDSPALFHSRITVENPLDYMLLSSMKIPCCWGIWTPAMKNKTDLFYSPRFTIPGLLHLVVGDQKQRIDTIKASVSDECFLRVVQVPEANLLAQAPNWLSKIPVLLRGYPYLESSGEPNLQ